MKILLLFPPYADVTHPYLSLPSLTAFLKQEGYTDVIQKDLNVEMYELLLTDEWLSKAYRQVVAVFEKLEQKSSLNSVEQEKYLRLARALLFAEHVIENVEKAKKIQRDRYDFYDTEKYAWSKRVLENGLELLSAAYYPSKLFRSSYVMRYSTESSQQILQAAQDERENIFLEVFKEETIPFILQQQPDLVGISVTYPHQIIPSFTLATLIKQQASNIHLTLGGNIISNLAENLARNTELFKVVDSFVLYEGEHALLELCRRIESGKGLKGVPNLIYQKEGEVRVSPSIFIEDINALPSPTYEGLPLHLYCAPEPVLLLSTSRGCYWNKCAFCTVSGSFRKGYRQRKAHLLLKDIQHLSQRYGTDYFYFADDSVNPKLLASLSKLLLKNNLKVRWQCEIRFEKSLTPDFLKLIREAGCQNLVFGLESACQRVLDLMQKGTNIDEVQAILQWCRQAGIAVNVQFFVGFPSESREESQRTLDFIIDNKHLITTVSSGFFLLQKGSQVEQCPHHYGVTKIHRDDNLDLQRTFPYEVTKGITMSESQKTLRLIQDKLRKHFAYSELSFGITAHTLLYLSHYGRYFFDAPQKAEENAKNREREILTLVPRLNDATSIHTFVYDVEKIEQMLHEPISVQTNPIQPEETTILFNANTGRMLQISTDSVLLLSFCNGELMIEEILSSFDDANRSAIIGFLKRLLDAGMINL